MKPKNKRLFNVTLFLIIFSVGCYIVLINLKENLIYFYSPSEIDEKVINSNETIRVGGMVKESSLKKKIRNVSGRNLEEISFIITDYKKELKITYVGILPDLFKEGQGVVVEGILKSHGNFKAKTVLAKHDENYMPPEIKKIKSINERDNGI